MSKIWMISGISSGLGQALADAARQSGDFVIGTFRSGEQANAYNEQHAGRSLALVMDVTDGQSVLQAMEQVQTRFGRLDVLVNNAGYGFIGSIEEASDEETRAAFEVNFFGALALTRAALPLFRRQRSGHILQISSHGGFKAFPGFGIYNAGKFALEGFSEALAAEIAPLGIRLTIVEPGPFRTQFAGRSLQEAAVELDDYQQTAGLFRQRLRQVDGKQEGDPQKAALALLDLVKLENPPLRLILGKVALATVAGKLEQVRGEMEAFRGVSEGVVF